MKGHFLLKVLKMNRQDSSQFGAEVMFFAFSECCSCSCVSFLLFFRSSALGFFTGVGRVAAIMGNIIFGKLVDTNCAVPVLLVSGLLLTGGLAALFLPQTRQTELT